MASSGRVATVALCLACVLSMVSAVAARQDRPATAGNRPVAILDVTVLGPDGLPVGGLASADFTILEDGRPRPIKGVTPVDLSTTRRGCSDVTNDGLADRPVVVFVIDDATLTDARARANLGNVAKEALSALATSTPGRIGVVFTSDKKRSHALTCDHAPLVGAIGWFSEGLTDDRPRTKAAARQGAAGKRAAASGPQAAPTGGATIDTLCAVFDDLASVSERRKAVVLFSAGVPLDAHSNEVASPDAAGAVRPGERAPRSVQSVVEAAERAHVTIYAVAPVNRVYTDKGMQIDREAAWPGGSTHAAFLKMISEATGGVAILDDVSDPRPAIASMFRENGSYYLVSYEPADAATGDGFHRIEMRVNRPDVTVRARSGRYEPAPGARPADEAALQKAFAAVAPKSDIELEADVKEFPARDRTNAEITIAVHVRRPPPAQPAEKPVVWASAYDESGQRRMQRVEMSATPGSAAVNQRGYEGLARLELPPGLYHFRVGAQAAGRIGTLLFDGYVPDLSRDEFWVSDVLSAEPASAIAGTGRLRSLSSLPAVPSWRSDFARDQKASLRLRLHQGGKSRLQPIMMTVRLVDAGGAAILERRETLPADHFKTDRAADYRVDLPLASLAPGRYALIVRSTWPAPSGHSHIVERAAEFTVR